MRKKTPNTQESAVAFDHQLSLLLRHGAPGEVERDRGLARESLEIAEQGAVFGFGPGLDSAFIQALGGVGNDQPEVKINGVSETLTTRTSAIGVVKGK